MAAGCPCLQWLGTYLQTDGRRHQPGRRSIHSPRTPVVYFYTVGPNAQQPWIIQYLDCGKPWGCLKIILVNLYLTETPRDGTRSTEWPLCRTRVTAVTAPAALLYKPTMWHNQSSCKLMSEVNTTTFPELGAYTCFPRKGNECHESSVGRESVEAFFPGDEEHLAFKPTAGIISLASPIMSDSTHVMTSCKQ